MNVMINFKLWKYIKDENCDYFTIFLSEIESIHYFNCALKIPLSTTERNIVYMRIMVMMIPELRIIWFLEESITALATQTSKTKTITWPSRIQVILGVSVIPTNAWKESKYGPEKTQYLDIFCAVYHRKIVNC